MITEKYLKPSEAAEVLRSSKSTLAKLRLSGAGPAFVRIGRAIRYRKSDLDCWMNESTSSISHPANRTVR
jgi:excisionase family DNA binding protein